MKKAYFLFKIKVFLNFVKHIKKPGQHILEMSAWYIMLHKVNLCSGGFSPFGKHWWKLARMWKVWKNMLCINVPVWSLALCSLNNILHRSKQLRLKCNLSGLYLRSKECSKKANIKNVNKAFEAEKKVTVGMFQRSGIWNEMLITLNMLLNY